MIITALSLFPDMFDTLKSSILGRAISSGIIQFNAINIRDYSKDKHLKCDDVPYGGGAGMVMTPQPIFDAINAVDPKHQYHRIYLSPKGTVLNCVKSKALALNKDLLLLCGRYEGVDQRVLDLCIDEEISIGDYILTGGELAAMVLIDSVSRFVPGVLGSEESAEDESFMNDLLEYPQYTRPQNFMGLEVPQILISGHHANIKKWREEQSKEITKKNRPELIK